jgi:hypothetical protein
MRFGKGHDRPREKQCGMYIRHTALFSEDMALRNLVRVFPVIAHVSCAMLSAEAKEMENPNRFLFPELDEPATVEERQAAVLRGVNELDAYAGLRPSHMFTMRLPYPLYVEFKKQVQRWQREAVAQNPALKDRYTMTAFVTASVQNVVLPMLKTRNPLDSLTTSPSE